MTFEEWWKENWKPSSLPGIIDLAFKELSERAWAAGYVQGEADSIASRNEYDLDVQIRETQLFV